MDVLRELNDNPMNAPVDGEEYGMDASIAIGTDERRMHVRAYNHWASLLRGNAFPSIEDLDPARLGDFAAHSVLLDFSAGGDNPAIAFLGRALRDECDLGYDIKTLAQVPGRSLLSRLTDHHLQIIANRAPIGFEAEFINHHGRNTLYRGILMPYSSDGDTIDFIHGVINWKETADIAAGDTLVLGAEQVIRPASRLLEPVAAWADGPHALTTLTATIAPPAPVDGPGEGWTHDDADEGEPVTNADDDAPGDTPEALPDEDAGLADWLDVARQGANAVRMSESRSRASLYRALGLAYDFALLAEKRPDDYAELLEDAGLKAQARAPMTPIVKLVFGASYDKARLTEFSSALSYGRRNNIGPGKLRALLETHPGGLKGVVKAERAARAPARRANPDAEAEARLRQMEPKAIIDLEAGEEEFVVLVARRISAQELAVLGVVEKDDALVKRAIRKVK